MFGTSCTTNGTMGVVWGFDPLTRAISVEHILSEGVTIGVNIGALIPFSPSAGAEEVLAVGFEKTTATTSFGLTWKAPAIFTRPTELTPSANFIF